MSKRTTVKIDNRPLPEVFEARLRLRRSQGHTGIDGTTVPLQAAIVRHVIGHPSVLGFDLAQTQKEVTLEIERYNTAGSVIRSYTFKRAVVESVRLLSGERNAEAKELWIVRAVGVTKQAGGKSAQLDLPRL